MKSTFALFGEAEKGDYNKALLCHSQEDIDLYLGQKTPGISLATQALSHGYDVLFFRVKEEGFSIDNYVFGLHFLNTNAQTFNLVAISLLGVGDFYVIEAARSLCQKYHCFLFISDKDLYDLATYSK